MQFAKIFSSNYCLIGFILSINFLLVSCRDNKYTQCEQIITIANQVARETQIIAGIKTQTNLETKNWLKAAEMMNQAAERLEGLSIKDPQLIGYLGDLVKIYRTNSEATYNIIKARESKNIEIAKTAQANVQLAGEWEKKLSNGINNYCQIK